MLHCVLSLNQMFLSFWLGKRQVTKHVTGRLVWGYVDLDWGKFFALAITVT